MLKWLAKELKHVHAHFTSRKSRRCNRMASHFWILNVQIKKKRWRKKQFRRGASWLKCTMCDQWFHKKWFYRYSFIFLRWNDFDLHMFIFFSIRVSFHRHWRFTGQQKKGGDHLLFHSKFSPAHEQWDIYLQLYMWDVYHVFLMATLVFIRLLLDEIYHLIESLFDWLTDDSMFVCLLDEFILGFCYSNFDMGNRWIWTRIDCHSCITSEPTNQVW